MSTAHELALRAKAASRPLASMSSETRDAALKAMAVALEESRSKLRQANSIDMLAAQSLRGAAALPAATLARLNLSDARLDEMIEQIQAVTNLPDPLGRTLDAIELDDANPAPSSQISSSRPEARSLRRSGETPVSRPDQHESTNLSPTENLSSRPESSQPHREDAAERPAFSAETATNLSAASGLHLQKISVPLGVLAVIFEARPDAVTQIAALAIKSGNAVLLKPGSEVEHTAAAIIDVLRKAIDTAGIPQDAIQIVRGREETTALLAEHKWIDLVIPRGSNALVDFVQQNTRIPVLGHADGVCHVYVDRAADEAKALRIIADSKCDYPAACNAAETVLIHREIAAEFLPKLAEHLRARGVRLLGDDTARALLQGFAIDAVDEWHTEYGTLAIALAVVNSIDDAIAHIHAHGSSHTESIVTEDGETAAKFLREIDAAGVYHNASTRFADGFRYGFGAEVGVSTSKLHARGPVGLEGLTTYKYILRGEGHIAADYRGTNARAFTHRR